jgi:hypothetical protein
MRIFTRSRRKAIAPLALALWLFALVTSIANACGLYDQLGFVDGARPAQAVAAHQESGDGTSPACDQFCADDTPLLSKPKASQDSPAISPALVVAVVSRGRLPALPRSSSAVCGLDPPPQIALSTRFVRLAL